MFFSTIFSGVSMSMIVPLVDKVFTNQKIILTTQKLPLFLENFLDKLNFIPQLQMLYFLVLAALVFEFLKGLSLFSQGYLMSNLGQNVVKDVRFSLYRKLQELSLDFYSQKRSGELTSRITNDVRMIENAVSYGVTDIIFQSFQAIMFVFLIFFIHWRLALVSFIMVPLVVIPVVKIGRTLRKLSKKSQEKIADISSLLFETILGVRIVKAFCMEKYETARFGTQNRDYYKITMKTIKRNLSLSFLTEFVGVLVGVFVMYWGAREVIAGKLSAGVFFLFIGSLFSLIRPFKKLSQVNAITQQALAANTRIYEILDCEPSIQDKPDALALTSIRDSIKLENVWLRYDQEGPDVLKEINLNIKVGELIAVVGPTGAGKTTLVNLIPRFYDPAKGRIIIDGVDAKELKLESLRSKVGMVTQETILFNDTVRANIAYGHLEANHAQIREAAHKAFADDFINKLPSGYDTVIGDRGFKLSGGEKQRLAIARAILKNPPILILDEATSQLDSESERLVQQALDILMRDRTVFCIAHRLSTVRKANRIVVLNKGRIVELGTHEDLLKQAGLYKRLHDTQFQI